MADYDLSEYLRQAQAKKTEAELAGLKSAYETSLRGYEDTEAKLSGTYDAARNQAAAQDAIARKNFNTIAASSGVNSGTAAQADLARSSVYQSALAGIDREQAEKASAINLEKANLQSQYQSQIAQAQASGDADLNSALYEEMVRNQNLNISQQDKQQSNLTSLIANYGYNATDAELAAAGMTRDQANALLAPYLASKSSSTAGSGSYSGGGSYPTGSLTTAQIKELQTYLGVTADGLFGTNSQAAAMSKTGSSDIDSAWAYYQQNKGVNQTNTASSPDIQSIIQDIKMLKANGASQSDLNGLITEAYKSGYVKPDGFNILRYFANSN